MTNTRRIASVSHSLQILGALADKQGAMGVSDLARVVGLGKSTVHALLATLRDGEFVEQTSAGQYRLGLGAFYVGSAAVPGVPADGRLTPALWGLAQECGEATSLAIAHHRDAVIVQRIESQSPLRAELRVGTRMPLHSSASGKCFLAGLSEPMFEALYPEEDLPPVTGHTLRSRSSLLRELDEVRRLGYATNRQEQTDGVVGVAALVEGREGKAALALSIAGPCHRFDITAWTGRLQDVAKAMTADLAAEGRVRS